jgi:hypothetical protein
MHYRLTSPLDSPAPTCEDRGREAERVDRAMDVVVAVPLRAASSHPRTTERRT